MKLDKIFQLLVPKETKFYDFYQKAADNNITASELLIKLLNSDDFDERNMIISRIRKAEESGDNLLSTIYEELNNTNITPFERDDMFSLMNSLENVVDIIDAISQRISYLRPEKFIPEICEIAQNILLASNEIKLAVYSLRDLRNNQSIIENCNKVSFYEKQCDDIFRKGITNLLNTEQNMVELIKKKEILEKIEECSDLLEDVTDIIRSIIVRNA